MIKADHAETGFVIKPHAYYGTTPLSQFLTLIGLLSVRLVSLIKTLFKNRNPDFGFIPLLWHNSESYFRREPNFEI